MTRHAKLCEVMPRYASGGVNWSFASFVLSLPFLVRQRKEHEARTHVARGLARIMRVRRLRHALVRSEECESGHWVRGRHIAVHLGQVQQVERQPAWLISGFRTALTAQHDAVDAVGGSETLRMM